METEFIDFSVVEEIDWNHRLVYTFHSRHNFPRAVKNGPIEISPCWNLCFDVKWSIGIFRQWLSYAVCMAKRRACPVGFRGSCDVDVINEPKVATRPAASTAPGLMNSKLRIYMEGCSRKGRHVLEVAG